MYINVNALTQSTINKYGINYTFLVNSVAPQPENQGAFFNARGPDRTSTPVYVCQVASDWLIWYLSSLSGQTLERTGGKDFQQEVKNLSSSHGNLDTAGGKFSYLQLHHHRCYYHGPHCTGKTGKWQKKSLSGKTQGIWKCCQNTGNLIFSSCKLPNSKSKRYFDICYENFQLSFWGWKRWTGQFCVCNNYKFVVGQGKHREFENVISVGTLYYLPLWLTHTCTTLPYSLVQHALTLNVCR